MNGGVIAGTPIGVDFFRVRDCPSVKVFFLTHAHADHMVGLTRTWRSGVIHMSPITARIVTHNLQVSKEFIKELEIGESHLIQMENSIERFSVTVIDANHCLGSVMYLFQGSFGNILHTGDFRYDPSMLDNEALSQCSRIHRLYLDNTYCDKKCVFGSREETTKEIIQLIAERPERKVYIGMKTLGKEKLLVDIAKHFKVPIVVTEPRFRLFEAMLCIPNVFSTADDASRIVAVNEWEIFKRARESSDDLLVRPTALFIGTNVKLNPNVVSVPYSDHSSYAELKKFVSLVKPTLIVPIVNYKKKKWFDEEDLSHRSDMSVFDNYLDAPLSPSSVHLSLLDCDVSQARKKMNVTDQNVSQTSSNGIRKLSKRRSSKTTVLSSHVVSKGVMFTDDSSSSDDLEVIRFLETSSEGSPLSYRYPNIGGKCDGNDLVAEIEREHSFDNVAKNIGKDQEASTLKDVQEDEKSSDEQERSPRVHRQGCERNASNEQLHSSGNCAKNIEANLSSQDTAFDENVSKKQEPSCLPNSGKASEENVTFGEKNGDANVISSVEDSSAIENEEGGDGKLDIAEASTLEKVQEDIMYSFPRKRSEIAADWERISRLFYELRASKGVLQETPK